MRMPKKTELENRLAEAAKAPHKLPETGNKRQRLADQTRKILGKHYARKYRLR